jgi:hypothetical protein
MKSFRFKTKTAKSFAQVKDEVFFLKNRKNVKMQKLFLSIITTYKHEYSFIPRFIPGV